MDLAAAERLLKSKVVAKTGFRNFPIETLAKLCERHGMVVRATGRKPKGSKKKSDYVATIVCYVSHRQRHTTNGLTKSFRDKKPKRQPKPAHQVPCRLILNRRTR